MGETKPLRCQKCGKPVCYVSVASKSFLVQKATSENVKLVATCLQCRGGNGFYRRNF